MRSSTSSGSLTPPRAKILMPLSGAGLCDAEIMTPKSAPMSLIRNAAAGVGMTPASSTSTPELASPAATAAVRNSPETRGSRATTAMSRRPCARRASAVRPLPRTTAAAWARESANSTETSRFARPRTPSVPKSRGMSGSRGSALRELRRLASLLETGLLALGDAGVTAEEAGLLEGRAVVLGVDLVQRTGDGEAQSAGLAGGAAAGDLRDHVVAADQVEDLERVVDQLLVQLVREVVRELTAVDRDGAAARDQADAGDGLLAAADRGTRDVEDGARRGRRGLDRALGGEARRSVVDGICDSRHVSESLGAGATERPG